MTENSRLSPGDTAPAFTLPDADGKPVSLADYRGRKVIVYFYPAASTPGCTKEACDFRDNLAELDGVGIDVVGISPDKPAKLAKFRDNEQLTFPLLSDPDREVLTAWGAFGEKMMYGKKILGTIRSTFVVNDQGVVAKVFPSVKVDGHDEAVLAVVKELGGAPKPAAGAAKTTAKKRASKGGGAR